MICPHTGLGCKMLDGKRDYCLVYDRADPHYDSLHGDYLLASPWVEMRSKSAEWGLTDPVVVKQFIAMSWEQACQHWYDLRGCGVYYMICHNDSHVQDRNVPWVTDAYTCRVCFVRQTVEDTVKPFYGSSAIPITREALKQAMIWALHPLKDSVIRLSSYTVSSEKSATDGAEIVVWGRTPDGDLTIRLQL